MFSLLCVSLVNAMSVPSFPPSPSTSPPNDIDAVSSIHDLMGMPDTFVPHHGQPSTRYGSCSMPHRQDHVLRQPTPQRVHEHENGIFSTRSASDSSSDFRGLNARGDFAGGQSHSSGLPYRQPAVRPPAHKNQRDIQSGPLGVFSRCS